MQYSARVKVNVFNTGKFSVIPGPGHFTALMAAKRRGAIRTRDPFAIVIYCTSHPRIVE